MMASKVSPSVLEAPWDPLKAKFEIAMQKPYLKAFCSRDHSDMVFRPGFGGQLKHSDDKTPQEILGKVH